MAAALVRLIGLGIKAGSVVIGTDGVRVAIRRGRVAAVVVASDCSQRTEQKVVRLARGKHVPVVRGPSATDLGRLNGRGSVQAMGLTDRNLVRGIINAIPARER